MKYDGDQLMFSDNHSTEFYSDIHALLKDELMVFREWLMDYTLAYISEENINEFLKFNQ